MTKRAAARSQRRPALDGVRGGLASVGVGGWHVVRRCCFWAPVWVPCAVLMHFTVLGLAPARAEGRRLDVVEAQVERRVVDLEAERHLLLDFRRCLEDEVYRERVRRTRQNANCEPLRLIDARRAANDEG